MKQDTSIIQFRQPGSVEDPLTEIAREGARRMLASALEAEIEAFVGRSPRSGCPMAGSAWFGTDTVPSARSRPGSALSRSGGRRSGTVPGMGRAARRSNSRSHILPRWARRSRSLDALLPVLYLRGISTGDFQEALSALLGPDAPNLSPGVISRLAAEWENEYERWHHHDLSARRYVYVWADGVYLQARMEPEAECILVLIGATPEGKKELVGFHVGRRESAQSWRELLVDLKARGLAVAPEMAVGDGALGFWKALDEVFPGTRHQRRWVAGCIRSRTC